MSQLYRTARRGMGLVKGFSLFVKLDIGELLLKSVLIILFAFIAKISWDGYVFQKIGVRGLVLTAEKDMLGLFNSKGIGGKVSAKEIRYTVSPLPDWVDMMIDRFTKHGVFAPVIVLIEYLTGMNPVGIEDISTVEITQEMIDKLKEDIQQEEKAIEKDIPMYRAISIMMEWWWAVALVIVFIMWWSAIKRSEIEG